MKHEEREVRQTYNDYGDDLYRLCYFYTGNVHDAMDAVQNTLVHLMEYTGTFESESHKKSWLLKVGVNECRQLHRQWWRRKVTADESLIDMERVGVQTSDVWESVMSLPTNTAQQFIYIIMSAIQRKRLLKLWKNSHLRCGHSYLEREKN